MSSNLRDSFDPFAAARSVGDTDALKNWERFAEFLASDILLVFDYSPFLQHQRPAERDEYGPKPEVWRDSTQQVVEIFRGSIEESLRELPNRPTIEVKHYTPPASYMRGGPIGFPNEIIHVLLENPWLLDLGWGIVGNAVYDAMKAAFRNLNLWFDAHEVPATERRYPSHGPLTVRSVVEGHAREFFPRLSPGDAKVIPSRGLGANYPADQVRFLVGVECVGGRIVYSVDDELSLDNIVRIDPDKFIRLRSDGWPRGNPKP